MNQRSYLDYNATAPLRPEVREAVADALGHAGNPSSVHAEGRAARAAIEEARGRVASLAGARPEDVIFTSGGTEANVTVLAEPAADESWQLYLSAIEHPSVLSGGRFHPETTTMIPVTADGVADLAALAMTLEKHKPGGWRPLVSLMAANNETGAIQPVREAADIVHEAGGLLHSDAVQAAGRIPLDMTSLGTDMLTLSAHKIGGPKGVGALVLKEGVRVEPLIKGGGQEGRRRAGTENVPGIVGFGVAAELAAKELGDVAALAALRDQLEEGVRAVAADAVIVSASAPRLPNTSCIAVPGVKAETLVIGLDLAGIAVSAGSACSSGKVETSHVLEAMGLSPEIAGGAVRVSLGFGTKNDDIKRYVSAFGELIKRLKRNAKEAA
ncbi:cysteine desulfurase family protein [Methyloceanibacter sp.]|jgi:cysteine desulfurase|uniref:cysteine desulfurase family protein n=1 Tax=Methyloceanibacter sp. TaxID=1965321 RepID=UPI003569305A